ncbi:response regulator [Halotalea alkalilenta]|uniref:response regulator n=1 Tax=Halotalea alkalilenta TaxID=376489 RepID=UPI0004825BFB|nr:response regulator [Halotalea alkalilenta]
MSRDRPHILVIDDEFPIRRFLRISLSSQEFEVTEASTGAEGVALAGSRAPDLILLDLGLPDLDGFEVLSALRQWSSVPVVVISARATEEEKVRLLDAGANDYVTKPFGIRELLARIRANLRERRSRGDARAPFIHGKLKIDFAAHQVSLGGELLHLTPKEYAVLERLATEPGRIVTQTQLLREIWGPTHVNDSHYLRIVVGKLRAKLGDDSTVPKLIATEPGVGYRFTSEEN